MWSTAPHLASTDFVDSQVAEKSDALGLARPAAASKEAAEILQTVLSVSIGYKGGLLSRWQSPRPSHIKVLLSNREGNEKKERKSLTRRKWVYSKEGNGGGGEGESTRGSKVESEVEFEREV